MRVLVLAVCLFVASGPSNAAEETLQSAVQKATQAVELARKGDYGRNRLTRSTNKARIVCKRVVKTGTRLIEDECLTIAQREARAKMSRERTELIQRGGCSNEASICSGGG